MSRRLVNITLDNLDDLPPRCRGCVFWELDPIGAARAAAKAGDAVKAKEYYARVADLTGDADATRSEGKEAQAFLAKVR